MRRWVKLHTKILNSPSLGRLTDHAFRACINLLALGGHNDHEGELGNVKDIAYHLRLTPDDALVCLREMAGEGITVERKGVWWLTNWCKYQSHAPSEQNDAVYDRVKKHRQKKAKAEESNGVTDSLHSQRNDPRIDKNREEENSYAADAAAGDPVKELAVVFEQASGIKLPQPTTRKGKDQVGVLWWKPLKEMVEVANGQAPDFLRRAVQKMRADHLTIAAPNSVAKVFASLHGETVAAPVKPQGIRYVND